MTERYCDLNSHLKALFGCRVQKITVDAGFSCPNRDGTLPGGGCIYCNARGSGTGAFQKGLSIARQLEAGKASLARRYKARKFIAYFQAFTNTYAPLEVLRQRYEEALAVEDIVGLAIGTRPDCVGGPILDYLEELAASRLIWLEYGLQSIHDATLERIRRGHDFSCFQKAVEATRHRGIRICAHVILGLPGENRRHMLATARTLAAMGLDGVKLHLLYVIRGTPLETLYQEGSYQPLSQAEYVDLVCEFLELLPPAMVIQRLTGDPHPHELLAPAWALHKTATLTRIRETLVHRNTWQGKRFRSDPE